MSPCSVTNGGTGNFHREVSALDGNLFLRYEKTKQGKHICYHGYHGFGVLGWG